MLGFAVTPTGTNARFQQNVFMVRGKGSGGYLGAVYARVLVPKPAGPSWNLFPSNLVTKPQ